MTQYMSAEDLFAHVQRMPSKERIKFFSLIAISAFKESDYSHDQVFGRLKNEAFSAEEAAEYLEVSLPTLRRYVQSGKLKPSTIIGRSQLFSSTDLRLFKQKLS
jgi:excisionase family DNA binding protein